MRRALRLLRMAEAMGLEPAGNRMLQIRCWQRMDELLAETKEPAAPAGLLRLAELLGFNRRSVGLLFRKRRQRATPA
jgi:hypothetical protein